MGRIVPTSGGTDALAFAPWPLHTAVDRRNPVAPWTTIQGRWVDNTFGERART
jgi:hypothetical protein